MKKKLLIVTLLINFSVYSQWQGTGENNGLIGDFLGFPSISVSSTNDVYLAHQGNDQKLDVLMLFNDIWTSIGSDLTTFETRNIQIQIDNNDVLYVVLNEKIDGTSNFAIKVLKYNTGTSSWTKVGGNLYVGATEIVRLKFDSNNAPYVAHTADDKIFVKKFDGTNWSAIGNTNFGESGFIGFDIDSSNTPYVCYASFVNSNAGKASVMKFDGANWVLVGNGGFSSGLSKYHNLSIDSNDVVHVGFDANGTNNGSSTVMKFNGNSWDVLGTEGMNNYSRYNNFLIATDDKKYVAFDEFSDNGLIVKTFNGTDWVQVGNNVTSVSAQNLNMAKAPNGTLFVTYLRDFDKKLYVKKFDTNTLSLEDNIVENSKVSIFPNPASINFTISLDNISIQNIEIFNLLGKQVLFKQVDNKSVIEIETSTFSKGMYLVKIHSKEKIFTRKLVIK